MNVTREDRRRLEAIVSDRNAPQKHVWRAKIILATADGCGTTEIMRRSGKAKPVVWRWQERFMLQGVAGLTRDKTRKPGKPPLPAATVQRVIDLALGPPPGEATHWTGRILAKAAGVSLRSVQRILEAHQLAPHRVRLLCQADPPASQARRFPLGRRPQGRNQPLHCRNKRRSKTLRLDCRSPPSPRRCQTRETSVRVAPLGSLTNIRRGMRLPEI